MSTATPDKAAAPKLEKKPVKFSNLLLGAGLNMFEVTTLGQVNTPSTCYFTGCFGLISASAIQNKNNHHHRYHPATTATATVESLSSH
jgi:hypothetical protein